MLSRRDFLKRSSLLAAAPLVPGFVARTAQAAEHGKDTILILIEMTGLRGAGLEDRPGACFPLVGVEGQVIRAGQVDLGLGRRPNRK